jgi:hypothetical protein
MAENARIDEDGCRLAEELVTPVEFDTIPTCSATVSPAGWTVATRSRSFSGRNAQRADAPRVG